MIRPSRAVLSGLPVNRSECRVPSNLGKRGGDLAQTETDYGRACYGLCEWIMRHPAKPKEKPPHAFVLEALTPLNPEVCRMFSGFAVYLGARIVCMLRDHEKSPRDNLACPF
jgi:hypothetical protein